MTIVILFLLYLVLPFAELAAIIVLAVLNGQKKRKIDELNRELAAARAGAAWRPENAWENAPERVPENAPERVPDRVWERTSESAPVSCEAENGFAVPQGVGDGLNSPSAPDFAQGYPLLATEETLAAPGSGGAATYVPAGCVEPDRGAPAPMRQDTPPAPASMRQDTPPAPAPMRQDTPPAPAPIRPDAPRHPAGNGGACCGRGVCDSGGPDFCNHGVADFAGPVQGGSGPGIFGNLFRSQRHRGSPPEHPWNLEGVLHPGQHLPVCGGSGSGILPASWPGVFAHRPSPASAASGWHGVYGAGAVCGA